jgi:hypothetical protein
MNPIEPDAHMRAALQHAPDADAAAPHDISAQILAAAHRQVAERPSPAPVDRKHTGWLGWRWRSPMGASGALATVLMAGLLGLLWRGEEPPGPVSASKAPPAAAAPAAGPSLAPPADVALPGPQREASARPAAQPPLRVEPSISQRKPATEAARQAVQPSREQAPQATAEVAQQASRRAQAALAEDAARKTVEPRKRLAAAAATPAQQPAVAAPPPPPGQHMADSAVQAAPAARPKPPQAAAAGLMGGNALRSERSSQADIAAARASQPGPPRLQAGDQIAWQTDTGLRAPGAEWLARLEQLTRGRWSVQPDPGPAPENGAARLGWQRGNQPVGQLLLLTDAVQWCDAQLACQRAPLTTAEVEALRRALAEPPR